MGSRLRRMRYSRSSRQLRFEMLEERQLLDAAVGTFLRTGGAAGASAIAFAAVPTESRTAAPTNEIQETLAHNSATAIADDESGFAFAHSDGTALTPTSIGNTIPVPQTTASSIAQATATDIAESAAGPGNIGNGATGIFQYIADPEYSTNLVFHGHLFVGGAGGTVQSEGVAADAAIQSTAQIGNATLIMTGTASRSDVTIAVTGVPGIDDYTIDIGGNPFAGSAHIHFVMPITDGAQLTFTSFATSGATVRSIDGGFGEAQAANSASVWGYVTGEGQSLVDGDFNGDGEVDGDDFDIWKSGNPRADGNEDGVVDDEDLRLWLDNTTTQLLPGDYNRDSVVDAADYTVWRNSLGQSVVTLGDGADGDGDGIIDEDDYLIWKANYGATLIGIGHLASPESTDTSSALAVETFVTQALSGQIRDHLQNHFVVDHGSQRRPFAPKGGWSGQARVESLPNGNLLRHQAFLLLEDQAELNRERLRIDAIDCGDIHLESTSESMSPREMFFASAADDLQAISSLAKSVH